MAEGRPVTEAMPSAEPFFQARDIRKSFGSLRAVDGCSLEVEKGAIVALTGPNGAGKTTLFNIAAGAVRLDEGQIIFRGEDISGLKPYQRAQKGLGRTFQITRVFPKMTLTENMVVASRHQHHAVERAMQYLELVRLADKRHEYASDLSFGQQKLLELAMALANEPDLLLLDEPTAGINPALVDSVIDRLKVANRTLGVTLLIIEHNVPVIMGLAEHIYCLVHGRVLADGPPEAIRNDPRVLEAYLGAA
jgi:ABC-type branched-subunit amino acid transport system ATPase component